MDEEDGRRFQLLLYTCNNAKPIHVSDFSGRHSGPDTKRIFSRPRTEPLVDIASYCLMPNHPHILIREINYGGISTFMQKVGTGYTMYFNKKYERAGALFSGPFKAVHVEQDSHFRRVVNYIHANPAELYEPGWKRGVVRNEARLQKLLTSYPFSSLPDYEKLQRAENTIVSMSATMEILDKIPSFATLLKDAHDFYRQNREFVDDFAGSNVKARP